MDANGREEMEGLLQHAFQSYNIQSSCIPHAIMDDTVNLGNLRVRTASPSKSEAPINSCSYLEILQIWDTSPIAEEFFSAMIEGIKLAYGKAQDQREMKVSGEKGT